MDFFVLVCYDQFMEKNIKDYYLVIDTETGGLSPSEHSLLSVAGVICSPKNNVCETLFDFYVKEPSLSVDKEALAVNKINLSKVVLEGLEPVPAIEKMIQSIDKYFGTSPGGNLILVGHNVGFDIAFLKRLFSLAGYKFENLFSHRSIDTASILAFLQMTNIVPDGKSSSNVLFDLCNIKVNEKDRHTALGDALATAQSLIVLFNKFTMKEGNNG